MLELCLVKVFEKFLYITFENVHFSFGLSTLIVLYFLTSLYVSTGMVHNVNGTMSKKWWPLN